MPVLTVSCRAKPRSIAEAKADPDDAQDTTGALLQKHHGRAEALLIARWLINRQPKAAVKAS